MNAKNVKTEYLYKTSDSEDSDSSPPSSKKTKKEPNSKPTEYQTSDPDSSDNESPVFGNRNTNNIITSSPEEESPELFTPNSPLHSTPNSPLHHSDSQVKEVDNLPQIPQQSTASNSHQTNRYLTKSSNKFL